MTKTQFRIKVKALKKGVNELIDNRIEKAINSGCLPLHEYDNNYILPKAFMSACGHEIEYQYKPLGKKAIRDSNNIKKFI